MTDHRREQIMDEVYDTLYGINYAGQNVYRGRTNPLSDDVDYALIFYQGEDTVFDPDDRPWDPVYRTLTILIECHVIASESKIEQELNAMSKAVSIALQSVADPPFGLSFCFDLEEGNVGQPELNTEGNKPVGMLPMAFFVSYQRSRADPSA